MASAADKNFHQVHDEYMQVGMRMMRTKKEHADVQSPGSDEHRRFHTFDIIPPPSSKTVRSFLVCDRGHE